MNNTLRTVEGDYPTVFVHHIIGGELQMIKNLTTDIIRISSEPNGSEKQTWAMFSFGAAISFFTVLISLFTLDGFQLAKIGVGIITLFSFLLGLYSYRDWQATKQNKSTRLSAKQKQLDDLVREIEARASNDKLMQRSIHDEAIEASILSLENIAEAS